MHYRCVCVSKSRIAIYTYQLYIHITYISLRARATDPILERSNMGLNILPQREKALSATWQVAKEPTGVHIRPHHGVILLLRCLRKGPDIVQ